MRGIDGNEPLMQILLQISGETGRLASRLGETGEGSEIAGTPLTVGSGRSLTQPVKRLRWRDRRDSNPKSNDAQSQSQTKDSALSVDALMQILMQIPDEDRRMLTQIVERWGDLSDELKRAVLRVVGSGR